MLCHDRDGAGIERLGSRQRRDSSVLIEACWLPIATEILCYDNVGSFGVASQSLVSQQGRVGWAMSRLSARQST